MLDATESDDRLSETEERIAGIWSAVLGSGRFGADDDFFAAGGNSLSLARVIARIRDRWDTDIGFETLYRNPTIRSQARLLEDTQRKTETPLAALGTAQKKAGVALSPAQRRMWYLCQSPGQHSAYVIPVLLEVSGGLDPQLALQALDSIVARHESLRSVIHDRGGQGIQILLDSYDSPFDVCHARDEDSARDLADEIVDHVFDLRNELPVRGRIIEIRPDRHLLAVNVHHIVCDAWSIGILFDEFCTIYGSIRAGKTPPTTVGAVQVAEASAWFNSPQCADLERADLDYWRQQLAGCAGTLELPTDRPRPAQPVHAGGLVPVDWPSAVAPAGDNRDQLTPFMMVVAAYALVLHRLSRSEDIVVGAAISVRPRREFEGLIGLFANTVPLRVQVDGSIAVADFLERVRRTVVGAVDHSTVPLETILETLRIPRLSDRMPLFQCAISFQNGGFGSMAALPGLSFSKVPLQRGTSKFDLTLMVSDDAGGLRGELEFDSSIFEQGTATLVRDYIGQALLDLHGDGQRRLDDIELTHAGASSAGAQSGVHGDDYAHLSLEQLDAMLEHAQEVRDDD